MFGKKKEEEAAEEPSGPKAKNTTYSKPCPRAGCGFRTNEHGTEQAADEQLGRHDVYVHG